MSERICEGEAFEQALVSVEPATADALRALISDSAYVEPRVVAHVRD